MKITIQKYISIMTVIDLNAIYKKKYYKYMLSFKLVYIIGVKHHSHS